MVKRKKQSRPANQPPALKLKSLRFKRSQLWLGAAGLAAVLLALAGWLIFQAVAGPRARALREAAPVVSRFSQDLQASIGQIQIALEQLHLAQQDENLQLLKDNLHRFLNVLEGQGKSDFDPQAGNPGDGTGILNYLEEMLALLSDARFQRATAALGPPIAAKHKQLANAVETARADSLGAQLHVKGALKAKTLQSAQENIEKAIGWLSSAINDDPASNDPNLQALRFAQARLSELKRAMR